MRRCESATAQFQKEEEVPLGATAATASSKERDLSSILVGLKASMLQGFNHQHNIALR